MFLISNTLQMTYQPFIIVKFPAQIIPHCSLHYDVNNFSCRFCINDKYHHHDNCFTALFPGPPGARKELLDFMVQGKINRGRHSDHPAGRHSIWTNQCPPPPLPPMFFTGRIPFLPPNQQCQSTEGNYGIWIRDKMLVLLNGVTCTVSVP